MANPRWHGALSVLAEMRRAPGVTRAAVAQRLGLSSGSATEITARLRELALLTETPAAATGRGRPTTVLDAAPHASREPDRVLDAVGRAVRRAHDHLGDRLRAVAVAVAATVQDGRVVQAATLG